MSNQDWDKLDNLYLEQKETDDVLESVEKEPVKKHRAGKHSRVRVLTAVVTGAVIGALLCAGVFALTGVHNTSTAAETEMDYMDKIGLILNYLDFYYLDELDKEQIGDILAKGLMENIGDKYSSYYTEKEFDQLMEESSGSYAGIGVQIVMNEDGFVEVYKVFSESPAEEAGIWVTDLIVEADGIREFETLDDLVSIVRGEEGTTVDIVVSRKGEEIPMTIERRNIIVDSVYGRMLDDHVGYIQIAEFNTATVQQFNDIVDSLLEQGMTSAVMDLRANPGGDYDAVVAVVDRVVPEGVIVTVENKLGGMTTENSDARCLDIPIVLVVDQNTASAAELFTMALRDYGMAQVVGTTTYGKGLVQSLFRLPDGSGLKFTTEKYYGPAGNWIQDTGIEPDYVVEFPEEVYEDGYVFLDEDIQMQKAAELLGVDWEEAARVWEEELEDSEEAVTSEEAETAESTEDMTDSADMPEEED